VERVVEERGRIVVFLRERTPRLGESVLPRATTPSVLVTVPNRGKPIRIEVEGRP
jgi:hypothetical protein